MLAWRMQHTERTLTGMKLTMHAGLVERNARADEVRLMDARTFFGLEAGRGRKPTLDAWRSCAS